MIKNTGQKKISKTMVTKTDITKRQEQLLEELNKCEDELSGQELHRQLIESGKAMGLTTVYRNLQVLIKPVSYTHLRAPRDLSTSRMPSSA